MFFGGKAKQMENESNNGKLIKPGCTKLNQVKWPNREKDDYANWVNRISKVDNWINVDSKVTKAMVLKAIFSALPEIFPVEVLICNKFKSINI